MLVDDNYIDHPNDADAVLACRGPSSMMSAVPPPPPGQLPCVELSDLPQLSAFSGDRCANHTRPHSLHCKPLAGRRCTLAHDVLCTCALRVSSRVFHVRSSLTSTARQTGTTVLRPDRRVSLPLSHVRASPPSLPPPPSPLSPGCCPVRGACGLALRALVSSDRVCKRISRARARAAPPSPGQFGVKGRQAGPARCEPAASSTIAPSLDFRRISAWSRDHIDTALRALHQNHAASTEPRPRKRERARREHAG